MSTLYPELVVSTTYVVHLPGLDGDHDRESLWLTEAGAKQYRQDPAAVILKCIGGTYYQHLEWVERGGYVQCCATTRKGRQCKHSVVGFRAMTLLKWLNHPGGYCAFHGGSENV